MATSFPCTNCGSPVASRRPSISGSHFCQASKCQAAKQRYYRDRRAATADVDANGERIQLLHDVINVPRKRCPLCDLEDALPGWAHRSQDPATPCFGVGNQGAKLGPGFLDTIHPDRVPGR